MSTNDLVCQITMKTLYLKYVCLSGTTGSFLPFFYSKDNVLKETLLNFRSKVYFVIGSLLSVIFFCFKSYNCEKWVDKRHRTFLNGTLLLQITGGHNMSNVQVCFSKANTLVPCDPKYHPVLIVGQLRNINKVTYDVIKVKLQPRVTKEVSSVIVRYDHRHSPKMITCNITILCYFHLLVHPYQ